MTNILKLLPSDEIFQLKAEYQQDKRSNKVNGGIGVFLDKYGQPFVLPVVKKVIKSLKFSNFNYLPIAGDPDFLQQTARLLLGGRLFGDLDSKLAQQAVVGGTNGLFIWGSLFKKINPKPKIIIGMPTWGNHHKIFNYLGFKIISYQHLGVDSGFNLSAFEVCLAKNKRGSILFHGGSTHNPTGVNPNKSQWQRLAKLIRKTGQSVVFDFAYLGLSESLVKDCFPVRLFLENKIPTSIIVSYSKNMTLYQHRVGALYVSTSSNAQKLILESHLQRLFRIVNSNPPAFGELIVKTILADAALRKEWKYSLKLMVNSLRKRRQLFASETQGRFDFILKHRGLFSLLGLTEKAVAELKQKQAIYLLSNSRLNFGGLALKDIPRVTQVIMSILK